jgi:hypothetical protein
MTTWYDGWHFSRRHTVPLGAWPYSAAHAPERVTALLARGQPVGLQSGGGERLRPRAELRDDDRHRRRQLERLPLAVAQRPAVLGRGALERGDALLARVPDRLAWGEPGSPEPLVPRADALGDGGGPRRPPRGAVALQVGDGRRAAVLAGPGAERVDHGLGRPLAAQQPAAGVR